MELYEELVGYLSIVFGFQSLSNFAQNIFYLLDCVSVKQFAVADLEDIGLETSSKHKTCNKNLVFVFFDILETMR